MANYRKSFNFRNGVQVDTDNFIVNSNGLVGLGTTVPIEILDVYGNIRSTGIVTTSELFVGSAATITTAGITTLTVGSAVTITSSGIDVGAAVTITSSGIDVGVGTVTATSFIGGFTGTATTATNLADGANITTGTISDDRLPDLITSNINISSGISTVNEIVVGSGVTINSSGINAAGVVTATSFVGDLDGNAGTATTATNAQGLTGTPNITVGVVTATSAIVGSAVTITSSGIDVGVGTVTATSFVGDVTGTSQGLSGTPNISVGIVTASSFVGNLTGISSTAQGLTGTPNIDVGIITATSAIVGSAVTITSSGIDVGVGTVTATSFVGALTGNAGTATTATVAQGLTGTPNINAGIVTASIYYGDGSGLTGISGGGSGIVIKYSNAVVGTAGTINFSANNFTVSTISSGIVTVTNTALGSVIDDNSPILGGDLTLDNHSILGNGSISINGIVTATSAVIGAGVTINASGIDAGVGIVTATGGFISIGNTTPIQISLVGNQLTFTAVGIGSTTLTLA